MRKRNRHKIGDHLMECDLDGSVYYASEMVRNWNGNWVHPKNFETRNPQEFVKARSDPKGLRHIRPEDAAKPAVNINSLFVGDTEVAAPTGPASHLYSRRPGIGKMIVEGSGVARFRVA